MTPAWPLPDGVLYRKAVDGGRVIDVSILPLTAQKRSRRSL
jgi:hypothetical protein